MRTPRQGKGLLPYCLFHLLVGIFASLYISVFLLASSIRESPRISPSALHRGGWGKLAGGVKWPPPPVRHLTKVNEMAVVSGHLSSLEVTRSKISKSCPL